MKNHLPNTTKKYENYNQYVFMDKLVLELLEGKRFVYNTLWV